MRKNRRKIGYESTTNVNSNQSEMRENSKLSSRKSRKEKGITLIALVATIIVLLILAGVTITLLVGKNGIINQSQKTGENYKIGQARDKLEVAFANAQIKKRIDENYSQVTDLDKIMSEQIENIRILGNIVIVDGYAFEIDRSVPKIGKYKGEESDLIFPIVTVSSQTMINNNKGVTFTITAKEEKNGINRIEVWFLGKMIDKFLYDNEETVSKLYTISRNGDYTIKAYADLSSETIVNVEGIIPTVTFTPDGDNTSKKEHTTTLTVNETGEKIKSMKYKWTTSVKAPEKSEFTDNCPSNNIITGKGNDMTGSYYLWVLIETESGKTSIDGTKAFEFNNEPPQITEFGFSGDGSVTKAFIRTTSSSKSPIICNVSLNGVSSTVQGNSGENIYIGNIDENVGHHEITVSVTDEAGNGPVSKRFVADEFFKIFGSQSVDASEDGWTMKYLMNSNQTMHPGANNWAWTGYKTLSISQSGEWILGSSFAGTQYYNGTAYFKDGGHIYGGTFNNGRLNPTLDYYKIGVFTM